MARGRKPSPKTAIRKKIKKLQTEKKANFRSIRSLEKRFGANAKRLGAIERRMEPVKRELERIKNGVVRLESNNEELNREIATLQGQL